MDFIGYLDKYSYVPIWIVGVIAFLSSLVALYKNLEVIREILKKILSGITAFFEFCFNFFKNLMRKIYNKTVSSPEFFEWQNKVLYEIYDDLINDLKYKYTDIISIDKTVAFPENIKKEYEAVYFQVDDTEDRYAYPFSSLYNKGELKRCEISAKKITNKKYIKFKPHNKLQRKFYRLMKPTIHFPNNIGYALNTLTFENGFHFTAKACTYKMNVCTSNVLEYELYKAFKKNKKKPIEKNILEKLKLRNEIHKNFTNQEKFIFTSGNGRNALLGVQAVVLCKNNFTGKYDVLRIRRSEKVDAKSGFLQFIPSGGFSALNNFIDYDTQFSEFSVVKAILRELLEECFGEEDFSGRKTNSTENIYSDKIIKKLLDNKNLIFRFLGSAFSLVSLRHELCFLLVIEDRELIDLIRQNEECSNLIQFISTDWLSKESFWVYSAGSDMVNDCELLNPTSAALWKMVENSKTYKSLTGQNN